MSFATLVILASVPLLGGRPGRLASVRLRGTWLVCLALGAQIVITEVDTGAPVAVLDAIHIGSYVAIAVAIWLNRRMPGLVLIGLGGLTNAVVIGLNGGTLPASARALRAAGIRADPAAFANSGVLAHPVLPWLGDVVATPSWLPFRNVISVGDLVILVGAVVFAHVVCASRPARALHRRRGTPLEVTPVVADAAAVPAPRTALSDAEAKDADAPAAAT